MINKYKEFLNQTNNQIAASILTLADIIKQKLNNIPDPVPEPTSIPDPKPIPEQPKFPISKEIIPKLGPNNKELKISDENIDVSNLRSQLQDGDHVLFERGKTFKGVFGELLSGTDESDFVIGSFGNGDIPAPTFICPPQEVFFTNFKASRKNIFIQDLEIIADRPNQETGDSALECLSGINRLIIQRCVINGFHNNLVIQSFKGSEINNISLINNQILNAYSFPDKGHSQGFYGEGINGLTILGNIFDHNGWNESFDDNATIFNHNIYLSDCNNILIEENYIENASSIGLKFASSGSDKSNNIQVINNKFFFGEVGISMGGNAKGPNRFVNILIESNSFDEIGSTQPTHRSLSWGIDAFDIKDGIIKDNKFFNTPNFDNTFLVRLGSDNNNVTEKNNV